MRVLFIGDIIGRPGRAAVKALVPRIREKFKPDVIIANGENSASGFGINEKTAADIFSSGVSVITTGNHVWDKKEGLPLIAKESRLLRPANYPPGVPGTGSTIETLPNGEKLAVLNLAGRIFMSPSDCPFRVADREIEMLTAITKNIFVDFHAEATSEKIALGHYLDGRVSAVVGTHTHVQTADETILPKGTAYITDAGMTGPINSIIGVEINRIVERFLTQMPQKFDVPDGPAMLNAVIVDIDARDGRATAIQRLWLTYP